jgi:catechol 2,3-dioxygenase-like lactoylglutathione lyase family enzyme
MKRFHVNLAANDLQRSVNFYTTLFGTAPTVQKDDYAKWMLDDPQLNFSLSESKRNSGINHVGIQMDSIGDLALIQERLQTARQETIEQDDAECCYARSSKTWVRDPDDVAWEAFVTHGAITHYGADLAPEESDQQTVEGDASAGCCKRDTDARCCI